MIIYPRAAENNHESHHSAKEERRSPTLIVPLLDYQPVDNSTNNLS